MEIDDARETYGTNSQIKFKTSMLNSSLCDHSDAYVLLSGTITVIELAVSGRNNGIEAVFKNCATFTDCISEINNTQMDNAKGIDVVMLMYNLKEYSNNFSKKLGILWQYYTDEPALTNAGAIDNFPANSVNNFPENCVISIAAANQETIYAITDRKLYVPIVTLSVQDNAKLLQQLKS